MSMILKFRMLSDENDNFIRDYEIPYDITLLDFHHFICKNLSYDPDNMTSFFLSDSQWGKVREFTLFDVGEDEFEPEAEQAPVPMESVVIGQVIHKNHDRLIYLFDMFGDRALFLELMATVTAEKDVKYPRVTLSEAEAPNQLDADSSGSGGSIFDDAMGEFNDFGGDDSFDDEY